MKSLALFPLLLSLPSSSLADIILVDIHNISSSASTPALCAELATLKALTQLSDNATALASATRNDTALASAVRAQASAAASQLATLEANTTLVSACDQLDASEASKMSCARLAALEEVAALTANVTAVNATSKAAQKLKALAAAEAGMLAALQGNATLTAFCAGLQTEAECREMARLQSFIDAVTNETASASSSGRGNNTRAERVLTEAKAELAALQGNATLVQACGAMASQENNGTSTNNAQSASSSSPSTATSNAPDFHSSPVGLLSTLVLGAAALAASILLL